MTAPAKHPADEKQGSKRGVIKSGNKVRFFVFACDNEDWLCSRVADGQYDDDGKRSAYFDDDNATLEELVRRERNTTAGVCVQTTMAPVLKWV